jgi:hypothetical protein
MMAQKIITGCATGHFLHGLFSEGGTQGPIPRGLSVASWG